MGDSESSFPLQRLVIGPSIAMALFGRAQYNKSIKGNVYSRDIPEALLVRDISFMLSPELVSPRKQEGDKLKVKITSRVRKIVKFSLKFLSASITQPCQFRSLNSCFDYFAGLRFASRSKSRNSQIRRVRNRKARNRC